MAQASTRSSSEQKRSQSSSNGSSAGDSGRKAATSVVVGVATGAAGLVGGALLGTRLANKPKRVLGVRVPGSGRGLDDVAKQVGKAGKQFKKTGQHVGQLTSEVQAARRKAEELGRIFT
jgi:hypothetical protein